jgi:hypothetical protein
MCTHAKISYVPALSKDYGDIEEFGKEYMKFMQLCALLGILVFRQCVLRRVNTHSTDGFSPLHTTMWRIGVKG